MTGFSDTFLLRNREAASRSRAVILHTYAKRLAPPEARHECDGKTDMDQDSSVQRGTRMADKELKSVSKRRDPFIGVRELVLSMAHKELLVLPGPSGRGRSTRRG